MLSFYFSFQGCWANRRATGRHHYPRPFGSYFKGPCRTSVGLEVLAWCSGGDIRDMMSQPTCDSLTLWGSVFFFFLVSGMQPAASLPARQVLCH